MISHGRSGLSPVISSLAMIHLVMSCVIGAWMLFQYGSTSAFHYLIFTFLALTFGALQLLGWQRFRSVRDPGRITWLMISAISTCVMVVSVMIQNPMPIGLFFLAVIPLNVFVTGQLKQLPAVLFVIMVVSAATILVDLVLSDASWRLWVGVNRLWSIAGCGFAGYVVCLAGIHYRHIRSTAPTNRWRINVATQYALVFTGISAMVIGLVTGVMIHQVRNAQITQVGSTFQTIAENFAKLIGSHLEQQTQKLQLLTEQVPIFKKELIHANTQYGNRDSARRILAEKNRLWEGPDRDDTFVMDYLNNPIIRALSRFRGHNSFHNDLVLIDGYGGLVASLGQKPEQFYFYDQRWWKITWNGGLGNIFIGDLEMDNRDRVPKLRIAVDIVDRTTNEVIGMLSSVYLLRTLLEDIQRFQPDGVDHISLTESKGRIIACTIEDHFNQHLWSLFGQFAEPSSTTHSGWTMGPDYRNQAALIGFSSLSTAYNVISDPLHRLGWHVVVIGSRSNALAGVTRSTKLAILVGLVAMALGVIGAIAAARVITRPIEDLTATASAMIDGDLDNRARLAGPEELISLSDGFNRLTERLRKVIQNLRYQTSQLAKAKHEAEAATKLKGEFLANMSHEIRTPLNAILGFADILESSIEDEKQRRHAQTIKTSGGDLLHLINEILDLSKIEAGRMEIHTGPVNLRALLDELQRIFVPGAEEKMIRMEVNVATDLPKQLMLDRVRLRQVLFNLIGNAVKFTDRGHVRCIAGGTASRRENLWNLVIEVHDTGIGIDPEAYTAIFDTFGQHHAESRPTLEGTGLGLAITKNIVEMMGGHIQVRGEQGSGATFSIQIPHIMTVDEEPGLVDDSEIADKHIAVHFEPASILVADDLEVNRRLITEALKSYPIEIKYAENGAEAVTLAASNRFDLILMDIRMPDMDGYGALERIRNGLPTGKPPVVATTAAGMKEDIAKITEAGFDDHLIRPFNQEELVLLLMQHLPHAYSAGDSIKSQNSSSPLTLSDIQSSPPWHCPHEAEAFITDTLRQRWEQVSQKQSIPEIIDFGNDAREAGNHYRIHLLERYGGELVEYAEGFDIYNLEKLLKLFDAVLSRRDVSDGKDKMNERS